MTTNTKQTSNKLRLDLLPVEALEETARAFMSGIETNKPWNWLEGHDEDIYYGALLRHLFAWKRGEPRDPKSGVLHLGHVAANALILLARSALR